MLFQYNRPDMLLREVCVCVDKGVPQQVLECRYQSVLRLTLSSLYRALCYAVPYTSTTPGTLHQQIIYHPLPHCPHLCRVLFFPKKQKH